MIVKQFTDEKYVAMTDINNLGADVAQEVESYRRNFIEMIQINDLDYVNIVETPTLVKKRFSKNVEIKGLVHLKSDSNDFILEMAKLIVEGKTIDGFHIENKEVLIKKYKDNKKDLTIVTNYIINNLDKLLVSETHGELDQEFPELSSKDVEFLRGHKDVKSYYSIANYQEQTNCSYETGRKALEKLKELNFYKKTKVGKKFVYKPTEKLVHIMKGSE